MSLSLKIVLLTISIIVFVETIRMVKKGKMPVKYSLVWMFSSFLLLFVSVFTNLFGKISSLIGFEVSSNLVIGIFISLLLLISMMLTMIVSSQNKKINMLVQELSILKSKLNK